MPSWSRNVSGSVERRGAKKPQHAPQVVQRLNGGGGVVDGGRERLDRDVGHDPDGEGRILLEGPPGPERDHPLQLTAGLRRHACIAEDRDHVLAGGDEIADGSLHGEQVIMLAGPSDQAADIDGLDRPVPPARHHEHRLAGSDLGGRGAGPGGLGDLDNDPPGHRHRPEQVDQPVEEQQEQRQAQHHQEPGDTHPNIRDLLGADLAQQRERERQRPSQHRERGLQHAAAVPDPHDAGGEGPGGHLDRQDRHRHHEAGQADRGTDDRGQHGARGRRGVLPCLGNRHRYVGLVGEQGQEYPRRRLG